MGNIGSSVVRGDDRFCFCFHRRERTVIRINLSQDENLTKRLWLTGVMAKQITVFCSGMLVLAKGVGHNIGQHLRFLQTLWSSLSNVRLQKIFELLPSRN